MNKILDTILLIWLYMINKITYMYAYILMIEIDRIEKNA